MKKIFQSVLIALVAAVPFLTSCEDDNGSNPTLTVPESFVLNQPEFSANNVYDLPKSAAVNLTTSQPDYGGWPAAVTYAVQVSLTGAEDGWAELPTTYNSTKMAVSGSEINAALLDLYRAANNDEDPAADPMNIFVRLRAYLPVTNDVLGEVFSNAVQLNVLCYDAPSEATLPAAIYVCGGSIADAWSTWKPMAPVYGKEGRFYTLVYNAGDGFKWGTKEQEWLGYAHIDEFDDQAGVGISEDGDGNIVLGKAGWYTLEMISKIVGNAVKYTLVVAPGQAGVIGAAVDGGSWNGADMVAPEGKDGEWTFDAFTGSGELRAYIVVPGEEWWRTEFTLYNGELYWRVTDIAQNWAENVGEEYSVTVGAGNKLFVNFDRNTGRVE